MHISLVPRHKAGENIFLPKHRFVCPFVSSSQSLLGHACVHVLVMLGIKEMRVIEAHASAPWVLGSTCCHRAAPTPPRYTGCLVSVLTYRACHLPATPAPAALPICKPWGLQRRRPASHPRSQCCHASSPSGRVR